MRRSIAACVGLFFVAVVASGSVVAQAPPLAPSSAQAEDDIFRLSIATDADRYAVEAPITVTAILRHLGSTETTMTSSGDGIVAFRIEHIDGPYDAGGLRHSDCRTYPVTPNQVQVVPFEKSAGFSASDPLAGFWRAWVSDPLLRMPAGTYRISATADYTVPGCGDASHTLTASTTVVVAGERPVPSLPSGDPPTKGSIPDDAFSEDGEVIRDRLPDFLSVWGTDQTSIAGYVRRDDLFPPDPAISSGDPPLEVLGEDLVTLVGYMVPGRGFIALEDLPSLAAGTP